MEGEYIKQLKEMNEFSELVTFREIWGLGYKLKSPKNFLTDASFLEPDSKSQ